MTSRRLLPGLVALLVAGVLAVPGSTRGHAFPAGDRGAVQADGGEGTGRPLSLDAALATAFRDSPAIRRARIALEQGRMHAEQGYADAATIPAEVYLPSDAEKREGLTRQRVDLALAAAEAAYRQAERDLRGQVVESYYAALEAEEAAALARANLERARRDLALARWQFEEGNKSQLELLQAEGAEADAEVQARQAEYALGQALRKLQRLIGMEGPETIALATKMKDLAGTAVEGVLDPRPAARGRAPGLAGFPPLEEAVAGALKKRPDLDRARQSLALQALSVSIAGRFYTANTYVYRQEAYAWEVARLDFLEQEERVADEVRDNYREVEEAAAQLPLLDRSADRARRSYRAAQIRFEGGLASARDLEDARLQLQRAEQAVLAATYRHHQARARLRIAAALDEPAG